MSSDPGRPHPDDGRSDPQSAERHPAPPPPPVTLAILAIIGAIFIAMCMAQGGDFARPFSRAIALQFGAKENDLISQGQYWRLVTPIFLHGGWLHILVNGYSLYMLGGSMERIYGPKKYLLIFLAAGVAGNALSYRLSPSLSLGASGALFGLVGAGLVFPIRFRNLIPDDARRSILRQLAFIAILNLGIGFSLPGIDNWAHVGGLLGGAFVALFLIPAVLEGETRSRFADAAVSALVTVAVGIVIASWALQIRYARQRLPVYYAAAGVPWWVVTPPPNWRYDNGAWVSPDGATVRIAEVLLNEPTGARDLRALIGDRKPINAEVDGKPGWFLADPNRLQFVIPVNDRLFELTLQSAPGKPLSIAARSDFAAIANSIRFLRPPGGFTIPHVTS